MPSVKVTPHIEDYDILKPISSTRYPIYLAFDRQAKHLVAIKTFQCSKRINKAYIQEKDHLQHLDHPNIAAFYQAKDVADLYDLKAKKEKISYIALEFVSLGDLYDVITKNKAIPDVLARMLFHQLVDAVSYLHANNTAHMDLKCENVMLDENYKLKVIDFDQSLDISTKAFDSRGTHGYRAPEVLSGKTSNLRACDIYSLGIILFIFVAGYRPYVENATKGSTGSYDYYYKLLRSNPSLFWKEHSEIKGSSDGFSGEFISLITKMLEMDPMRRATVEDIRKSAWYNGPVYEQEQYVREMRSYLRKF